MAAKKVSARLQKALAAAEKERTKVYDQLYDRLIKLGFGDEYADLAAGDIADDWMECMIEDSEMPEIPAWHESDYTPPSDEESEEDEEEEEESDEVEELELGGT